MKRIMLALVVVLALASMSFGGTFAGFCDTEMVSDSAFTTGDLDLKVARYHWFCLEESGSDDLSAALGVDYASLQDSEFDDASAEDWECDCVRCIPKCDWRDDEPWGSGLERAFNVQHGWRGWPYKSRLKLWNAGCVDGTAYIDINIVEDKENGDGGDLSPHINMQVWYDDDGNGRIDWGWGTLPPDLVVNGKMDDLAGAYIELGELPAEQIRKLIIIIWASGGNPGDCAEFNLVYGLVGIDNGFCDTEESYNCFRLKPKCVCP